MKERERRRKEQHRPAVVLRPSQEPRDLQKILEPGFGKSDVSDLMNDFSRTNAPVPTAASFWQIWHEFLVGRARGGSGLSMPRSLPSSLHRRLLRVRRRLWKRPRRGAQGR